MLRPPRTRNQTIAIAVLRDALYAVLFLSMPIRSFACKDTQTLYEGGSPRRFRAIAKVAIRKLTQLDAAMTLDFLRSPPVNRLESLKGNRSGQYSIRVNDQWRVCFVWTSAGPERVEIVDYH